MPQVLKKSFYLILTVFFGLFVVSSFFIRAEYNYAAYGDNPILKTQQPIVLILLVIVLFALALILYRLCLRLNRYRAMLIVPIVLGASLLLQLALIFLLPRLPTDDSQTV